MENITFGHVIPTTMIIMGVLSVVAVSALSYWLYVEKSLYTLGICFVRLLFLGVLMWCLFMPELRKSEVETLKPRFVVAVDTSSSMLLAPEEGMSNRWSRVQEVMSQDWVDFVKAECEIDVYPFDAEVGAKMTVPQVRDFQPEGKSTLLRDSLKKITSRYAGQNVAGFVLLSDGQDTREAYDDWAAEPWPMPLYTIRLEEDHIWEKEPDVGVDAVNTPRRVSVGWKTELKCVVRGQGTKGQNQSVQLFKDGQRIAEQPFQIPVDGGSRELTFELENPDIGVFTYRIFVPLLEGEKNKEDNEYEVTVLVIDAKNRLLYVEGTPRWESKFLTRALKANKQAIPLAFIQGPGGKFMTVGNKGSMTTDMRADQLAFFKIVVLGNLNAEELGETRAQNLVKFVEDGGSLALLGGLKGWGEKGFIQTGLKKAMPIRSLTPAVVEGTFAVQLTDEGRSHPAFAGDPELWSVIPPVLSIFPNAQLSAAAQTLIVAVTPSGPQPLIVAQRYGQGKIICILTDSLWKWKLSEQSLENNPYQRFWDQLISWMTPDKEQMDEQSLEIFADREQVYIGEEVELSSRKTSQKVDDDLMAAEVQCEITDPEKRKIPFAMGKQHVMLDSGKSFPGYAFKYKADKAGLYSAISFMTIDGKRVESDPVSFFVKPFTPESIPKQANMTVLRMLATSSGGKHFDSIEKLNEELRSLTFATQERESVEFESLWNNWWLLIILMSILTGGWIMRKVKNFP